MVKIDPDKLKGKSPDKISGIIDGELSAQKYEPGTRQTRDFVAGVLSGLRVANSYQDESFNVRIGDVRVLATTVEGLTNNKLRFGIRQPEAEQRIKLGPVTIRQFYNNDGVALIIPTDN